MQSKVAGGLVVHYDSETPAGVALTQGFSADAGHNI